MIKLKKLISEDFKPGSEYLWRMLEMRYDQFNAIPTNLHRQNLFISALGDFLSAMESGGMSRDKEYKIFNNLYKDVTKAQKELSRLMPKLKKLTNDGKVYKALHDLKGKVK